MTRLTYRGHQGYMRPRLLFGVLRRSHTEVFAEDGREVGKVREAYGIGHLGDVDLLFLEQAGSLLEADVTDKFAGRDTGQLLHLAVELCTADAYCVSISTLKSLSLRFLLMAFMMRSMSCSSLPFTSGCSTLSACCWAPVNLPFRRWRP